jgi:hypothetical protein
MAAIVGAALMVIDRACVAVPPIVSVTLMVKLYVPAVYDLPEIAPVDELSDKPVGREPVDTDQV